MSAMETLVIILAVALAIFLVVSIILAVLLIRVALQIKHLTESAKQTVDSVQRASSNLSKLLSPATFLKAMRGKKRDRTNDDR